MITKKKKVSGTDSYIKDSIPTSMETKSDMYDKGISNPNGVDPNSNDNTNSIVNDINENKSEYRYMNSILMI